MPRRDTTKPFVFFFLVVPHGISSGWVHDRFGTGWMLQTDAISAILFVVVALFVLHKINATRAQGPAEAHSPVG
jgi:hypothetical protein